MNKIGSGNLIYVYQSKYVCKYCTCLTKLGSQPYNFRTLMPPRISLIILILWSLFFNCSCCNLFMMMPPTRKSGNATSMIPNPTKMGQPSSANDDWFKNMYLNFDKFWSDHTGQNSIFIPTKFPRTFSAWYRSVIRPKTHKW